ncbi:hypothetical protein EXU85_20260 [Spirosoma sp. KCTC 42546]|nr:hypothetical protein EXU85_20260 [Spirosoma sp. KCTC 42546]
MEKDVTLFWQVYKQTASIETCIAELKRKGFSQLATIKVLLVVSAISLVDADKLVSNSLAWSN